MNDDDDDDGNDDDDCGDEGDGNLALTSSRSGSPEQKCLKLTAMAWQTAAQPPGFSAAATN